MIYICTALYIEAEPLINEFHLKKDTNINKFQIFTSDKIILIITGKGKIKSAIALTYLLTQKNPSITDIIINIGLCGSTNHSYNIGDIFLCNKILDADTKRTYYPDILFKHPFKESDIECFSIECSSNSNIICNLVDMESSAIYESAITFFNTSQIFFIKIISDHINTGNIDISALKNIIKEKSYAIIDWIKYLINSYKFEMNIFNEKDIEIINEISNNLKLSCTMKNELIQIIKYYKLVHKNYSAITNFIINTKCKSKKEGKKYLEEIRTKFI